MQFFAGYKESYSNRVCIGTDTLIAQVVSLRQSSQLGGAGMVTVKLRKPNLHAHRSLPNTFCAR